MKTINGGPVGAAALALCRARCGRTGRDQRQDQAGLVSAAAKRPCRRRDANEGRLRRLLQIGQRNGGVNGRKIEWIVENDSYNPQQTAAVVKKLVDRDDVFALVSTLGTVTEPRRAAFPGTTRRAGRQSGRRAPELNKPTDKNVFGILPLAPRSASRWRTFAVNKLGAKRVAIFFQNDQFGKDQRDGAVEYLKKKNMQPVGRGELRSERCRRQRASCRAAPGKSGRGAFSPSFPSTAPCS